MNTACSNPLKGNAAGNPITITDASPNEHELKVTVKSKNLIPYPYYDTTKTVNGITFTDNGDGSVTVNGTAAETAFFYLIHFKSEEYINSGIYAFSGCPSNGGNDKYQLLFAHDDDGKGLNRKFIYDNGSDCVFSLSENQYIYSAIIIRKGTTVNSLVFKPQLEEGSAVTEYKKYLFSALSLALSTSAFKGILSYIDVPVPVLKSLSLTNSSVRATIILGLLRT